MRWHGAALGLAAWGIVTAVATAVVVVPAPVAGAAPCAFAPASVAVVVDFGDGSPVSAVCVAAQSSDNGAAVLAARAQALGTPAPRFDSSGFVCGIDGYPETGCGEQTGSTYAYWSYWHGDRAGDGSDGSSVWDYSNVGAGGSRIHSDVAEGWRFQPHGAGNPSDPPPNGSPDAASTCSPPTSLTPPTSSTSVAEASTTSVQASLTTVSSTTSTTTTVITSTTGIASSTSATTSRSSSQIAAGPVRVTERAAGSHSSPWPAVATGGAIVALGATGVVVARRRRNTLHE